MIQLELLSKPTCPVTVDPCLTRRMLSSPSASCCSCSTRSPRRPGSLRPTTSAHVLLTLQLVAGHLHFRRTKSPVLGGVPRSPPTPPTARVHPPGRSHVQCSRKSGLLFFFLKVVNPTGSPAVLLSLSLMLFQLLSQAFHEPFPSDVAVQPLSSIIMHRARTGSGRRSGRSFSDLFCSEHPELRRLSELQSWTIS